MMFSSRRGRQAECQGVRKAQISNLIYSKHSALLVDSRAFVDPSLFWCVMHLRVLKASHLPKQLRILVRSDMLAINNLDFQERNHQLLPDSIKITNSRKTDSIIRINMKLHVKDLNARYLKSFHNLLLIKSTD